MRDDKHMYLLQSDVDVTVIALWLGQEGLAGLPQCAPRAALTAALMAPKTLTGI